MKSIIICEGATDYVLLQYFMRAAFRWQDYGPAPEKRFKRSRVLKRGTDYLTIGESGGSSQLIPCLDYMLELNSISAETEAYENLVIVTDRDEIGTEQEFIDRIKSVLINRGIQLNENNVGNNQWIDCQHRNGHGKKIEYRLLLLVIPFEETGAMETFLLNAISSTDTYDADIIRKGNDFVDHIDPEKRYLSKRRYMTKSKFDVYFSVRTAADQFTERQNILKNVKWEEYIAIQESFSKLGEL